QARANYLQALAIVLLAEGRPREAHEQATAVMDVNDEFGGPWLADAIADAAEAALALDDLPEAERLVGTDRLQPAKVTRLLLAQSARIGALVAVRRGQHEQAEAGFRRAADLFREIDSPYWLAVTLLQHAELPGADEDGS